MTTFADPTFTIAPLAPAPAPFVPTVSSGPAFSPSPVGSDWSARYDNTAKEKVARRSAIERARESAEAGWSRPQPMTKSQRLAQTRSKATRDHTGSEDQRRKTRGSVAAAIAKVADVPSDTEFSDPQGRVVREILRQRYPGRKLSAILERGEQLQAALNDDPVAAREDMLAAYSRMTTEQLPAFRVPVFDHGVRGSIQRARQDAADAADLRAAQDKHGKNLPKILADLEAADRALHSNPAVASARIAVAHGAPVTEAQVPAYEAAQAAKAEQKYQELLRRLRLDAVNYAIQHGHIPGDTDSLNEIAAVLVHPRFQKHPTDPMKSLLWSAQIITHPEYVWTTSKRPGRSGPRGRDPGSLSISGGSPSAGHSAPRGTGGVRASVERAMGA